MPRAIDIDAALDRYYAEWELQDICSGEEDRDWLMKCINEAPTVEPKQEWISVKDIPPEEEQEVLCFCAGNLTNVYAWTGEEWVDSYGYYEDDDIISHWMPLPEPPKEA